MKQQYLPAGDSPKSTSAETFRTIRTNINYLLQGKERQAPSWPTKSPWSR